MKQASLLASAALAAFTSLAQANEDCDSLLWHEVEAFKENTISTLKAYQTLKTGSADGTAYVGGQAFVCSPIIGLNEAPQANSIKKCFDTIVAARVNSGLGIDADNRIAFLQSQIDVRQSCADLQVVSRAGLLFGPKQP